MLAGYNSQRDAALIAQLRTLYRGRPYTKAVPFQKLLPSTNADEVTALWTPQNAHFEAALLVIRADTAGVDLNFCDTTAQAPFLFAMAPTTTYQVIDIHLSGTLTIYAGRSEIGMSSIRYTVPGVLIP